MANNTFDVLATQTVSSTVSSVTFSSIDQTYTDLYLVMKASRGITGSGSADANITFNGDTGSNYSNGLMYEGGAAKSSNRVNLNWMGSVGDGEFKVSRIHIQDYSNNTTIKTAIGRWGSTGASESRVSSGQWRNTAPITSITITPANGIAAGSSFTLYGIRAANAGVKAIGGLTYSDTNYWYHVFTSTAAFVPNQSLTADILVVAGGGGSQELGGGGGAGGLLVFSSQALSATSYTCTVGAGGTGGYNGTGTVGGAGGNSQFGALTTAIGGGGGGRYDISGNSGGSGGGGGRNATSGGSGTSGQGNAGGNGLNGWNYSAAGGGGAGAAGGNATNPLPGNGGIGYTSSLTNAIGLATGFGETISGSTYFAGGGGGGVQNYLPGASGGYGGGGQGGTGGSATYRAGANGLFATGGGGGGGNGGNAYGGNGGSGVVIIRYAK